MPDTHPTSSALSPNTQLLLPSGLSESPGSDHQLTSSPRNPSVRAGGRAPVTGLSWVTCCGAGGDVGLCGTTRPGRGRWGGFLKEASQVVSSKHRDIRRGGGKPRCQSRTTPHCWCLEVPWGLWNCSDPWAPLLKNVSEQLGPQALESVLLSGSLMTLTLTPGWGLRLEPFTPQVVPPLEREAEPGLLSGSRGLQGAASGSLG